MKSILTAFALAAASLTALAAPNHSADYTFNGTTTTANSSAAGAQLLDGETLAVGLHAAGNDYFQVTGNYVWVPIQMQECGTRWADLTFSALLDGVLVASGGYSNVADSCVHLSQGLTMATGLAFDELHFEYTQLAHDTATNTMGDLLIMNGNPTWNTAQYVEVADVAEPTALALLAVAGLGAAAARRRRRA